MCIATAPELSDVYMCSPVCRNEVLRVSLRLSIVLGARQKQVILKYSTKNESENSHTHRPSLE